MTTKNLNIIGIVPGTTTGTCLLVVPRATIFGSEPPSIIEWDGREFTGPEPQQAIAIARYTREVQSLDYHTGPALLIEDDPADYTDHVLAPVRIGAMLSLLYYQTHMEASVTVSWLGDSTLTSQSRMYKDTKPFPDDRLKKIGLYSGSEQIRAATKNVLIGLRRAREDPTFAKELWPR